MTRLLIVVMLVAGCRKTIVLASSPDAPDPIGDAAAGDAPHQTGDGGGGSNATCPCLTSAVCDTFAQCADDGLCVPLLPTGDCGGAGQACCGGGCGSCGVGLLCTDGTCKAPTGGGTLGAACTLQCDGSSNCDPGEYCPNSCTTCPCTNTCHPQASLCTIGNDQTCAFDPAHPPAIAQCVAAQGPFATKCTCLPGSTDPATGKCM